MLPGNPTTRSQQVHSPILQNDCFTPCTVCSNSYILCPTLPFSYTTATVLTAYSNAIRQTLRDFYCLWKATISALPIVSVHQVSLCGAESTSLCVSRIPFISLAQRTCFYCSASCEPPVPPSLWNLALDRQDCSHACCPLPAVHSAISLCSTYLFPFTAKLPLNGGISTHAGISVPLQPSTLPLHRPPRSRIGGQLTVLTLLPSPQK
jgi:hypothetical protein